MLMRFLTFIFPLIHTTSFIISQQENQEAHYGPTVVWGLFVPLLQGVLRRPRQTQR